MMARYTLYLLLIFCSSSLAADTTINWDLSPSDTSYQYLAYLFGHVSDDLVCYTEGCSQVVPLIFQAFNQSLLIMATMLLTYVSVLSVGASAHQGEFLGRKYSSLWMPLKLIGGMSFVVPTGTGYCLLQIIIIKVSLMGVALANNMYGVIDNYVNKNNVSFSMESQNTKVSEQYQALLDFSKKVFPHELCYAYYQEASVLNQVNPNEAQSLGLPDEDATFYKGPQEFSCDTSFFGYDYNNDSATMTVDCAANQPLLPPNPDTCGYWTYVFEQNDPDPEMTQKTLTVLVENLRLIAQQDVHFYLNSGGLMDSYLTTGEITAAQQEVAQAQAYSSIQQLAYSIAMASSQLISQSLGTVSSQDVSYGEGHDWLDFLENYYDWISKNGSAGAVDFIGKAESTLGAAVASTNAENQTAFFAISSSIADQDYFKTESIDNVLGSSSSENIGLKKPSGAGDASSGSAADKAYSVFKEMLSQSRDPLISLAIFGQKILQMSFDILFSSIMISAAIMIITAICSSKNSTFAAGITTALGMFVVNTMLIFGFLIPVGVLLGIYLPTMPVMVYAFGAVHWFISVIEAVVAGPIIGIGFMAPTQQQDLLGKASPALMLLLQVFIRPAGMVLGMVFGAKLFDVMALYFTQSFLIGLAFLQGLMTGTSPIRVLIFVIYFFFYSFVIVGIANRCYSLINVLPDKLIFWVGGPMAQVGQEVEEDMGVYRQAIDRSGQDLKEQVSSLAQGLGSSSQSLNESIKKSQTQTNQAVAEAQDDQAAAPEPAPAPPAAAGGAQDLAVRAQPQAPAAPAAAEAVAPVAGQEEQPAVPAAGADAGQAERPAEQAAGADDAAAPPRG